MRTQFTWTSRARGLLADALEYSKDVMAVVSERTPLAALPVPDEPLLSWGVYLANTPAKWLGTVEAATPTEAIAEAAEKFNQPKERLTAVRRA